MNVSLTPELERLVHERVESGLYNNASEVIREALRETFRRQQERDHHADRVGACRIEPPSHAERRFVEHRRQVFGVEPQRLDDDVRRHFM